jgi:hypothetical protein
MSFLRYGLLGQGLRLTKWLERVLTVRRPSNISLKYLITTFVWILRILISVVAASRLNFGSLSLKVARRGWRSRNIVFGDI